MNKNQSKNKKITLNYFKLVLKKRKKMIIRSWLDHKRKTVFAFEIF